MKNQKPNIIILLMSCNKDIFLYLEKVIRDTWLEDINKFDNINYYFYRIGDYTHIDEDNHIMYISGYSDDLDNTFLKTKEAFKMCENMNYDYIVRTNCTTYINLWALNILMQEIYRINEKRVLCGDYSFYEDYLLIRGNSFIFNREHIKEIISFDTSMYPKLIAEQDDVIISYIFQKKYNIGYTLDSIKENTSKYYAYIPCLYFNDADRYKHPFARFDKDFIYEYNIHEKLSNYNKFDELDLLNSVFICYRKGLNHNINRYNELGECFKIDNYIRKIDYPEDNISLDILMFFLKNNQIVLWYHEETKFMTI